jgi:hypothetical protein
MVVDNWDVAPFKAIALLQLHSLLDLGTFRNRLFALPHLRPWFFCESYLNTLRSMGVSHQLYKHLEWLFFFFYLAL